MLSSSRPCPSSVTPGRPDQRDVDLATRLLRDHLNRELERDAGTPLSYYEILVVLSEAADGAMRMVITG